VYCHQNLLCISFICSFVYCLYNAPHYCFVFRKSGIQISTNVFSLFSSVPPVKSWYCISNQAPATSSHILSISSFFCHPVIGCCIIRASGNFGK
jgi:hypothetical protein